MPYLAGVLTGILAVLSFDRVDGGAQRLLCNVSIHNLVRLTR